MYNLPCKFDPLKDCSQIKQAFLSQVTRKSSLFKDTSASIGISEEQISHPVARIAGSSSAGPRIIYDTNLKE